MCILCTSNSIPSESMKWIKKKGKDCEREREKKTIEDRLKLTQLRALWLFYLFFYMSIERERIVVVAAQKKPLRALKREYNQCCICFFFSFILLSFWLSIHHYQCISFWRPIQLYVWSFLISLYFMYFLSCIFFLH